MSQASIDTIRNVGFLLEGEGIFAIQIALKVSWQGGWVWARTCPGLLMSHQHDLIPSLLTLTSNSTFSCSQQLLGVFYPLLTQF